MTDARQELEDEDNARFGDPRKCSEHGYTISSPDGMFDGVCPACEGESAEKALKENPMKHSHMSFSTEFTQHTIMVLGGEVWGSVDGCEILTVSQAAMDLLEKGSDPADIPQEEILMSLVLRGGNCQ